MGDLPLSEKAEERASHTRSDGSTEFLAEHEIDQLVQANPAAALEVARTLLEEAEGESAVLTWLGVGRCLFELGRIDDAGHAMERSLALVQDLDAPQLAIQVGMSAAAVLAESGEVDGALTALDALRPTVEPLDAQTLGRLHVQRSYVLQLAGRLNEALEHVDIAEPLLRDVDDEAGMLRLLIHRGLVQLQRGHFRESETDLRLAMSQAAAAEQPKLEAQAAGNLAVLYGRNRRLGESMAMFDRTTRLHEAAGHPARVMAITELDRAEVAMHSGLVHESVEAADRSVALAGSTSHVGLLADAMLVAAQAHLSAGRLRSAAKIADDAHRLLQASGRTAVAPIAAAVAVRTELSRTDRAPVDALEHAALVAAELSRAGWSVQADQLAVARVRSGRRWGRGDAIRDDVDRLRTGADDGRRDTALAGWWAEAISHEMNDDPTGAIDACHDGLTVLDDIVAEAPSLEARSAAMRMGGDLSQLLIELAIDVADADTVLSAAEGTRARALHDELAERERYRPLTRDGADDLRSELAARLGERTLVEWVVARNRIWAVVFGAEGSRLVEIGPRRDVVLACDRVRMWLDVAAAEPDEPSGRAMDAARRLDDLLIAPLDLPPDSGVALVPTDILHGIPWSGLPSFAGRPISLTPNAQVWLEADRRAGRRISSAGLVVGPGLVGSDVEREAFARAHPGAAIASGDGATAATTRALFAEADLVHVAAHGTFRSDHPLLSTIRLHDGEATLYDAIPERVESLLVVLSSCEGGAQGTADGSEVLGLSAVLLARGAAAVLAPLTTVRELECADFVAEVHDELAAGEPFACAVAAVRQRWLAADDLSQWAVASSFSCFGSGAVSLDR